MAAVAAHDTGPLVRRNGPPGGRGRAERLQLVLVVLRSNRQRKDVLHVRTRGHCGAFAPNGRRGPGRRWRWHRRAGGRRAVVGRQAVRVFLLDVHSFPLCVTAFVNWVTDELMAD